MEEPKEETFSTPEGLLRLGNVLRSSSRYQGWTHAAGKVLRAELLPEVTRRLAEAQPRLRGSEELQNAFEHATNQMTWLQTPPQEEEPPVPTLAQPAPRGPIGLARLEPEDGRLHLWPRATPSEGEFGDVSLGFDTHPSFGKDGRALLNHLGGLEPGEVKPVPQSTVSIDSVNGGERGGGRRAVQQSAGLFGIASLKFFDTLFETPSYAGVPRLGTTWAGAPRWARPGPPLAGARTGARPPRRCVG